MKYNEILEEIYRLREEHARECGYDIHKMFEQLREGTERLKAEGWRVEYPAAREAENPCLLREEPPSKKETP
ncbi:MAG: hypothetical protein NTW03_05035 [Verrucomicrobia bacterium]|nr:hypothetical protein [Verrucomicrobiota bacterium]